MLNPQTGQEYSEENTRSGFPLSQRNLLELLRRRVLATFPSFLQFVDLSLI
ncbi:MAG: hypothetical protein Ct9H90mP27_0510 [Gammaproteobacteria bacterium]|nr:MAG: hypothetical protein Ct9H90mP27_0510 [Gammaproteobacteria bacterium]